MKQEEILAQRDDVKDPFPAPKDTVKVIREALSYVFLKFLFS